MIPTIRLDNPDFWGLVSCPLKRGDAFRLQFERFERFSFADLHRLFLAFGGEDWMATKKVGELSVEAAVVWADSFGYTLLNWVPWGFWFSPVSVTTEGVKIAGWAIDSGTTEAQFHAMDWESKINYIMSAHAFNSQFVLRLRHEVAILGGKKTFGYPLGRKHTK